MPKSLDTTKVLSRRFKGRKSLADEIGDYKAGGSDEAQGQRIPQLLDVDDHTLREPSDESCAWRFSKHGHVVA
jgi:hypothetical protein